jgi:hypothetical protein
VFVVEGEAGAMETRPSAGGCCVPKSGGDFDANAGRGCG